MAWELVGRWGGLHFIPPFSSVAAAAVRMISTGQIVDPLIASLAALLIGYGMAVVLGVPLGFLVGRFRTVEYVLGPYLNAFLATPKIALAPVLFTLFGINRLVQVAIIFLSAFFIIVLNTARGIQTVDVAFLEMARSFGARERHLFWKVLLPGAMPLAMAGLRLAIGNAVKGMITGEMLITLFGLGALLRTYGNRMDAERVFAILLVVISIALLCSAAVQAIEQRLTHWTDPAS